MYLISHETDSLFQLSLNNPGFDVYIYGIYFDHMHGIRRALVSSIKLSTQ
jgi:hypothetical protein